MEITRVWFDNDHIYIEDTTGRILKQSLLWYERLRTAASNQREKYTIGVDGIHWRELDEDVSFESFEYEDAEPSQFQKFFLTHKEINVAEFAKRIGLNPTLLRNYINGFKTPSQERIQMIMESVARLGQDYIQASKS